MTLLDRDMHDFRFERTFFLAEVINPAVHSLELLLKERGFTKSQIHLADFSAVPMLWLDRLSFQLVIFHLLANAIKYASPKMPLRVVVGASHIGDKFHVSVCDWGDGIDEDERELLFTPGHRGKKARAADARGTGLGLATCKSIVEAHGGTMTFGSLRSPTEVQISLPDSLRWSAPNHSNP
jgi:two-component system phosphate regulon sensor histidine kinase PhoR